MTNTLLSSELELDAKTNDIEIKAELFDDVDDLIVRLVREGKTTSLFQFATRYIRNFNNNWNKHVLEYAQTYVIEAFSAQLIEAIQSNNSHCSNSVVARWEHDANKDRYSIEVNCICCGWSKRIEEVNESIKQ